MTIKGKQCIQKRCSSPFFLSLSSFALIENSDDDHGRTASYSNSSLFYSLSFTFYFYSDVNRRKFCCVCLILVEATYGARHAFFTFNNTESNA